MSQRESKRTPKRRAPAPPVQQAPSAPLAHPSEDPFSIQGEKGLLLQAHKLFDAAMAVKAGATPEIAQLVNIAIIVAMKVKAATTDCTCGAHNNNT